jgi:L-ascorbate metabolism protein UlaG (beta-lactamase superfamily)
MFIVLGVIGIAAVAGLIFVNTSPQFGGSHSKEDKIRYSESGHYENGVFVNLIPTNMDMGINKIPGLLWAFIKGNPRSKPDFELPMEKVDSMDIVENQNDRLIWFGHSAFLLELNQQHILIDPMLGESPAPHPTLGSKRFSSELPIEVEKLPRIDVVLISHDHYDHLDYGSILKLKDKTSLFLVPLGVKVHLLKWGIEEERIREYNWWDESSIDGLDYIFAPSRHFSGRGLTNRSTTLWGSWIIRSDKKNLYFSGDGGYGPHFKEIGEKYGPFDFAMMECGQYNEHWADIHMMPEETAQAAIDVRAKLFMPIHWGSFSLALHDWDDPVIRVTKKADELGIPVTVPVIGEEIGLDHLPVNSFKWWKEHPNRVNP